MIYTYYDITDNTIFDVANLHRNPYIRKKYLKSIFPINIKNLPNLKVGDIIVITKEHPETKTIYKYDDDSETTFTHYKHIETHELIVKKIKKDGSVYVRYNNWYDDSFAGEIKRFLKRVKNKLLLREVYTFTEKESYDYNKERKLVEQLEEALGIKDVIN